MAVIELASLRAFTDDQPDVPRAADRDDRRRAQHDHRQHAAPRSCWSSRSADPGAAGQSEELQAQQEELRRSNAELEAQAQSLKASEELLQTQQEELQQTNEELQEKAQLLASRTATSRSRTREIELARVGARGEGRAAGAELEVQVASSSPTCRTSCARRSTPADPRQAAGRQPGAEPRPTSRSSSPRRSTRAGNDLLDADQRHPRPVQGRGRQDGRRPRAEVRARRRARRRRADFRPVAEQKGSASPSSSTDDAPATSCTDEQRLQQVLKNLLSNAFKFTEQGTVELRVDAAPDERSRATSRSHAVRVSPSRCRDTGIGIAAGQAAPHLRGVPAGRRHDQPPYGGTGLGLSISREIARLLGGEIRVESTPGEGSTFTLFLPRRYSRRRPAPERARGAARRRR